MRFSFRLLLSLLPAWLLLFLPGCAPRGSSAFELREGDRVVFLGDTLIEREQHHGWLEVMLASRFSGKNITFRNLGWSADTPQGDSRLGLSLLQAGHEPSDEGWNQLVQQLRDAKATVVLIGYGMANSFDREAGLADFHQAYARLLDTLQEISPGVRFVLLGPVRHERLGAPWPDGQAHTAELARYSEAVGEIAAARQARFVSLFEALPERTEGDRGRLTSNGIHLNDQGYRLLAESVEQSLFGDRGAWRTSAQAEPLRQAILRKNEWFFHRSRPANMAYIFGFRKHEQGRNAVEVAKFDGLIAAEEKRIAALRALEPTDGAATAVGTADPSEKFVPQPHPEFQVADGFEVTLWAENPLVDKPIQMNFDPHGRLWVAPSTVYPQIQPGQAATDRIIVLEDTTADGRADQATAFAEGLLIPTGVAPGDGGVYVAQSTELLHFRDTDGDGRADSRRIVLSGFGTEDSHHNLHTLRWGPDGRLYMNQSVYTRTDTETPHGVVRLRAGGIFRFDPRDQYLQILYRGWVNAWGHQFDAFGQSFVTDGAGTAGINWAVPGATYRTLAPFRRVLQSVSPGSYPKFSGLEIIRSDHFPTEWQGDLVTCDFRANRVVRFKITDEGSGYVTQEMPDVLRTTADSFRPVDARLGPDGALYIADWSNPIIQHGEVDFRDPRRDKVHGRIWRVAAKGHAPLPVVDLTRRSNAQLFDALLSRNGYDQQQARRVLVERGAEAVLPDLRAWMETHREEPAQLQALWMLQAFNEPAPDLLSRLLAADDPRVRAAAVRVLSTDPSGELDALARLVADEHPRVRLEAVRALGRIPSVRAADLALSVLDRPMDPFLDYALWLTINELAPPWIEALKTGAWPIAGREAQLEFGLKAVEPARAGEVLGPLIAGKPLPRDGSGPWIELIGTAGTPTELRQLLDQLVDGGFEHDAAVAALEALADAARLRQARPQGDLATFASLFEAPSGEIRIRALRLAGEWKLADFRPQLLRTAGADAIAAEERAAAFAALRNIGGMEVIRDLRNLITPTSSPAVRREAVVTLATLDLEAALPEVLTALKATPDPAEADLLWRGLLRIQSAGGLLAEELPKDPLPAEVAQAGLRPAREGNQNQALVHVLMEMAGLTLTGTELSAADLQALAREALAQGEAARGEHIYRRPELACVACHAIGGAGGKLGPDLTSIGASAQPDYLVESLIYPNAKIKEGYHGVRITTHDQQVISGMIVSENDNEVVVRDTADQEVSVATANIADRSNAGSLMPAGLIDTLLPEERLHLIKFLSQLGNPGPYDASKGGVARTWRLYLASSANTHLGIERVVKGDFALPGWETTYSLVNGVLPPESYALAFPERRNTRALYLATRFHAKGGAVSFTLDGGAMDAWINGQPVEPAAEFTIQSRPGVNTIVLRVDDEELPDRWRLGGEDVSFLTE